MKDVYVGKQDGDPKGKRAGHKDKMNEIKKARKQNNSCLGCVCVCVCKSQALEIVCNFFKKKERESREKRKRL